MPGRDPLVVLVGLMGRGGRMGLGLRKDGCGFGRKVRAKGDGICRDLLDLGLRARARTSLEDDEWREMEDGGWRMKVFEGSHIRAALVVRQTEGFRRAVVYITAPMSAFDTRYGQMFFESEKKGTRYHLQVS